MCAIQEPARALGLDDLESAQPREILDAFDDVPFAQWMRRVLDFYEFGGQLNGQ